jgi:SAM-dependent methyltransferase
MPGVTDHYADGTYRWWHLSRSSPELLQALAGSWLPPSGLALDAGYGLGTEAGHLYQLGWRVVGVDLSPAALAAAARCHQGPSYLRGDLLRLPLRSSVFDACLDRGCFHYLVSLGTSLLCSTILSAIIRERCGCTRLTGSSIPASSAAGTGSACLLK